MAKYGASFATAAGADVTLRFPPAVSARQRAILHAVAEANGVAHASAGDGEERYVSLGSGARVIEFLPEDVADDEAVCALLAEHLRVAPEASRRAFAAPAPRGATRDSSSRRFGDSNASSSATGSSPPPASASRASVDVAAFVRRTLELLDLEREAEAEQGEAILRGMRPETAQRRGRALLGLKCVDVRGGFFGKTVVTLELASRGAGATEKSANSTAPPLPPHKLTPHDVVALRANKGDAGGDPLCAGVVYRVRDAQLEIALDETPDDGTLDGTLRLERLANETSHKRLVDAVRDIGRAGETGEGVDLARFPGARLVEVLFGSAKPKFATVRAVKNGADGASASAREDESDVADSPPIFLESSATVVDPFEPIDRALDRSQKNAVARALAAEDVALIHGPPGTGKTTAVVEYVLQERLRGRRVLCCAASNVAVDTLVERLLRSDFADADSQSGASSGPERGGSSSRKGAESVSDRRRREKSSSRTEKSKTKTREKNPRGARRVTETLIRLGHPARLLPSVLDASLEAAVARSDDSALARDCERECADLRRRLAKLTSREHRAERADARRELRRVQKETKARQKKAVSVVVSHANIVCCTLSGSLTNAIRNETFDVVVIDEAAQALEPACWGAMFKARKTVLAGDHLQLPPTVVSDAAAKGGLATTLFARAHHRWPEAAVMLTTQYRMHASIAQWASDELYQGRLVAAPSAAERRLTLGGARGDCTAKRSDRACCAEGTRDLRNVYPGDGDTISESTDVRLPALVLVDTAGCGMEEQREEEGDSTGNPSEARVAFAVARRLVFSGSVLPEELGIIAPYSAQVGLLRELRAASEDTQMARVEIATVDGFQGREKDCVVLSATRSNEKGDVGFLADARRMNVAVTRARMHCVLVCDTDTVGRHDAFLRRLVAHFEARGEYVAASEFDGE
jgi:superfamily I DNA and/or RNA helicase